MSKKIPSGAGVWRKVNGASVFVAPDGKVLAGSPAIQAHVNSMTDLPMDKSKSISMEDHAAIVAPLQKIVDYAGPGQTPKASDQKSGAIYSHGSATIVDLGNFKQDRLDSASQQVSAELTNRGVQRVQPPPKVGTPDYSNWKKTTDKYDGYHYVVKASQKKTGGDANAKPLTTERREVHIHPKTGNSSVILISSTG